MNSPQIGQDKEAQQRAINKAQSLGTVKTVRRYRYDKRSYPFPNHYFTVPSANKNRLYHVTQEFVCNCEAGERGVPCYHAAAAWLYEMTFNRLPGPSAETLRRKVYAASRKPLSQMTKEERKAEADAFRKLLEP